MYLHYGSARARARRAKAEAEAKAHPDQYWERPGGFIKASGSPYIQIKAVLCENVVLEDVVDRRLWDRL